MGSHKLFDEFYIIDQATNSYMIEVALDQYSDIFSEWDPAPFKRREIDPDLALYLEGSSEEIPAKYPIEICFLIPPEIRSEKMEEEVRAGLSNGLTFKIYLTKKELRKTNTRILQDLFLGFFLLWLGTIYSDRFGAVLWNSILAEGVFIGGWVFLWEAVSLFFFTNRELGYRYRTYRRLLRAPVIFRTEAIA